MDEEIEITLRGELTELEILEMESKVGKTVAELEGNAEREAAKLSGLAKLKSLGLTEDEARAVIGL